MLRNIFAASLGAMRHGRTLNTNSIRPAVNWFPVALILVRRWRGSGEGLGLLFLVICVTAKLLFPYSSRRTGKHGTLQMKNFLRTLDVRAGRVDFS